MIISSFSKENPFLTNVFETDDLENYFEEKIKTLKLFK